MESATISNNYGIPPIVDNTYNGLYNYRAALELAYVNNGGKGNRSTPLDVAYQDQMINVSNLMAASLPPNMVVNSTGTSLTLSNNTASVSNTNNFNNYGIYLIVVF